MKLRIQGNSIRFRLKENEVDLFNKVGQLADTIMFGPQQQLAFRLIKSNQVSELSAEFDAKGIHVYVPDQLVSTWALTELVGMENMQELHENQQLKILIEKDFPCKHTPEEKQALNQSKI